MSRWQLVVTLPLLLSGCELFSPTKPQPVAETPVCPAPPEPVICPEPVEIVRECPPPVVQPPKPAPVCATPTPVVNSTALLGGTELLVIGAAETVYLDPPGQKIKALIDTGVETSVLRVDKLTRFERDGNRWVRFSLRPDKGVEPATLERPQLRRIKINRPDAASESYSVIRLRVRLADIDEEIDVALTEDSNHPYALLLGRNFLTDNAVVDVAKRFTIR